VRKITLIALAVAATLAGGAFDHQAAAMTVGPLRGAATANAFPVQQITNICGINGCAPVLTKRIVKPPRSFTAKAAPLVVSGAPAPAPAAAPTAPWPLSLLQRK
jgi:hypothetical protein